MDALEKESQSLGRTFTTAGWETQFGRVTLQGEEETAMTKVMRRDMGTWIQILHLQWVLSYKQEVVWKQLINPNIFRIVTNSHAKYLLKLSLMNVACFL